MDDDVTVIIIPRGKFTIYCDFHIYVNDRDAVIHTSKDLVGHAPALRMSFHFYGTFSPEHHSNWCAWQLILPAEY